MRFCTLTVVAAATIALVAGQANARDYIVPHKPFATMTNQQKVTWLRAQIHKDQTILRFWRNHRRFLTMLGVSAPHEAAVDTRWARVSMRIAKHNLAKLVRISSGFPPHHALWVCIGRHEGGPHSVNPNGHYGMLQMHADWGYGTSRYASNDPQSVQEWAAERAYQANHYSPSFLYGQWFNYDGAAGECMPYA